MTREQALDQLNSNPNATFNAQIAAKMIDALSRVDLDVRGLQIWLQDNYADSVSGSQIRAFAKRPASLLPAGV